MSAVSRALGRRGTSSLETVDREEYDRIQTAAISKAINTQECAVKEKHIRTAILGTHREKGAGSFWYNVQRLQIEGSPFLSWKFCHVLHKLMRDGHSHVLSDSLKYRSKITDLGKLWGHLKEGYGPLICQYAKLLLTKLEFHYRNPGIPGNLLLTDEKLEAVGAQDVNNWYQLAVEMLDYLDDILTLQRFVFNSLDMSRASSMTPSGQCRLAPLILCILDSSSLYDYLVKMLFKLHAACAPDVLDGHRDRFNTDFKSLKQFYSSSSNLQYFKYLVSIPPLPDNPPNFLVASDFDNYVTPEVRLHNQGSEAGWDTPPDNRSLADSQLIDVSETTKQDKDKLEMELAERDQIINTLRHDLGDTKEILNRFQAQSTNMIQQLQNRILQLERELTQAKQLIEQLSDENERYRTQAEQLQNEKNQQTAAAAKLEESEKKAQNIEEKFHKMKEVYAKLRDEHIETLKKLGTLQKEADFTKKNAEEASTGKNLLEARLLELQMEHSRAEEKVQQSSSTTQNLLSELQESKLSMERLKNELQSKLSAAENELAINCQNLNSFKLENDRLSSKLLSCGQSVESIFRLCCTECGKVVDDTLEQFDNPAHLGVTSTPEFILTRTGPCLESLELLKIALTKATTNVGDDNYNRFTDLIVSLVGFTPILSEVMLHGKATSNVAPSNQIEILVNICKNIGLKTKQLFHLLETKDQWSRVDGQFVSLKETLEELESAAKNLLGKMGDVSSEELGELFEKEMKLMDAAVQQAASKIQEMLTKSKESDTGVRLEVNSKILDSCTALMLAVMELIHKARDLQNEIVQRDRGTGSVKEFYKRHHQWTEGLLSAAKNVGVGAQVLVNAADKVISGNGKFEELMAASQEIAASTAQLVVASKVKADRGSVRLSALSSASKGVTSATANVLGTVKSGREVLEEKESMDFSKLSLHQAKRLEMEVQVKVLELESALEKERVKLAEVRKRHYQLGGASEGWENNE